MAETQASAAVASHAPTSEHGEQTAPPLTLTDHGVRPGRLYRAAALAAALLLVAAAILKAQQLIADPLVPDRPWMVAQVCGEWILGLWLASGLWPRSARAMAIACFAVFAVVSGLAAWRGDASCGCFGELRVPPAVTATLDMALVAILLVARPAPSGRARSCSSVASWTLAAGATAGVGCWLLMHPWAARMLPDGTIRGGFELVVLEPAQWVGKPLPLLGHLDAKGAELAKGRWQVLFYDETCPECRSTLRRLGDVTQAAQRTAQRCRLAIVQLAASPPAASATSSPAASAALPTLPLPAGALVLELASSRRWRVTPSTLLTLDDGKVEQVTVGQSRERDVGSVAAALAAPVLAKTLAPDRLLADLGYVRPDSVHAIRFVLANESDQPRSVRSVESECGCAVVHSRPEQLPARGSAPLDVVFHAPDETMSYRKAVIVHAAPAAADGGSQRRSIRLEVAARIGLPLVLEPQDLDLGVLEPGSTGQGTVQLVNDGPQALRLLYSTSSDGACYALVPRDPVPGGGGRIGLIVKAGTAGKAAGSYEVPVQLATGLTAQPTLHLTVRYQVR